VIFTGLFSCVSCAGKFFILKEDRGENSPLARYKMNKKFFFLVLLMAFISFAQANETSVWDVSPNTSMSSEFGKKQEALDSVKIYNDLIALEDKESSCAWDVVGIVVGGSFVGAGSFFLASGIYYINKKGNDEWGDVGSSLAGGLMMLIAVPFYIAGIPILVNNIGDYRTHKKHAAKRDEYQEALDRYKLRQQQEERHSVQLMVIPTVNLAKASFGANAILLF